MVGENWHGDDLGTSTLPEMFHLVDSQPERLGGLAPPLSKFSLPPLFENHDLWDRKSNDRKIGRSSCLQKGVNLASAHVWKWSCLYRGRGKESCHV